MKGVLTWTNAALREQGIFDKNQNQFLGIKILVKFTKKLKANIMSGHCT